MNRRRLALVVALATLCLIPDLATGQEQEESDNAFFVLRARYGQQDRIHYRIEGTTVMAGELADQLDEMMEGLLDEGDKASTPTHHGWDVWFDREEGLRVEGNFDENDEDSELLILTGDEVWICGEHSADEGHRCAPQIYPLDKKELCYEHVPDDLILASLIKFRLESDPIGWGAYDFEATEGGWKGTFDMASLPSTLELTCNPETGLLAGWVHKGQVSDLADMTFTFVVSECNTPGEAFPEQLFVRPPSLPVMTWQQMLEEYQAIERCRYQLQVTTTTEWTEEDYEPDVETEIRQVVFEREVGARVTITGEGYQRYSLVMVQGDTARGCEDTSGEPHPCETEEREVHDLFNPASDLDDLLLDLLFKQQWDDGSLLPDGFSTWGHLWAEVEPGTYEARNLGEEGEERYLFLNEDGTVKGFRLVETNEGYTETTEYVVQELSYPEKAFPKETFRWDESVHQ